MSRRNLGVALACLACLVLGGGIGYFLGIWSTRAGQRVLKDLVSSERPADVAHSVALRRPGFALDYPGNWSIDTSDDDYDPDHYFCIESPGSCHITIIMFKGPTNPADNVKALRDELVRRVLTPASSAPLNKWGACTGEGVHLRGRMVGHTGGVRIFSWSDGKRSFLINEHYFDEDLPAVRPGFDLIERTFRLIP